MCVFEIFIDRYPDGQEYKSREEWRVCRHCPLNRPENCPKYYPDQDVHRIRDVPYDSMSSRSSESSSRRAPSTTAPSTIASRDRRASRSPGPSRRRSTKKPEFTPLVLNALFGGGSKRTTKRSESRSRTTVVVEDRVPRIYPLPPSPTLRRSYESGSTRYSPSPMSPRSPISPATPSFSGSWEDAVIIEASPLNRGRRGLPIIHDENRRPRRSDSTEVHATTSASPSRARTPSPVSRRHAQQQAEDEARRRRRNLERREAELAYEIDHGRAQQRRAQEAALHDAEIRARPPRPLIQQRAPPVPQSILRTSTARPATESVIGDFNMSRRGDQVIREAIAEREAELAAREVERAHAERRRLRSRFERVEYRDDPYRR